MTQKKSQKSTAKDDDDYTSDALAGWMNPQKEAKKRGGRWPVAPVAGNPIWMSNSGPAINYAAGVQGSMRYTGDSLMTMASNSTQ